MPHCVAARARIHYEVDGEGEPLVLIAGTAFDLSFWDDLLPELRGFRVLRLDNRGAGLSDAPDEPFSIEQMADDVVAVMDAAGMASAPRRRCMGSAPRRARRRRPRGDRAPPRHSRQDDR